MARGGEAGWEEAEALLNSSDDEATAADDRRLQAWMLLRGGLANRNKARSLVERHVAGEQGRHPADALLLVRIDELDGNLADAAQPASE